MKLSFRWYGEDDKVTLENIRQHRRSYPRKPGVHRLSGKLQDGEAL